MTEIDALLDRATAAAARNVGRTAAQERIGLRMGFQTAPTELVYTSYRPSLSMVMSGRKRSIVGSDDQTWGRERFLVTPVDLPVVAGVVDAGPTGFVSAVWTLDPVLVAEIAAELPSVNRDPAPDRLGTWTAPLADAVARLMELLDAPEDIPALIDALRRETIVRLLQSDQAERILAATTSAEADTVRRAIALVSSDLAEPWSLDGLARELGVSASTLGRRFGTVTGMSPAQYQKRMRLGEARRRMLAGESAAQVAAAVGYRSASHFSQDYRSAFELPPRRDAAAHRASAGHPDAASVPA